MRSDFKQLEKDANMTVKAVLTEVEEIVSETYNTAVSGTKEFPYKIEERKRVIVRRIWALVRKCMAEMRSNEYSNQIQHNKYTE